MKKNIRFIGKYSLIVLPVIIGLAIDIFVIAVILNFVSIMLAKKFIEQK